MRTICWAVGWICCATDHANRADDQDGRVKVFGVTTLKHLAVLPDIAHAG
jgi:hypothetical protein